MTKRRVLLVDDEVAILLTLKAVLEINGFTVDTATSARDARIKITSHEYAMIITDMRMESETAGYDVIRAARQAPYNPATALLTAYPSLGTEWQNRGAQSLLVKPVNTQELLRQLEALLITHQDHKAGAQKAGVGKLPASETTRSNRQAAGKRAD